MKEVKSFPDFKMIKLLTFDNLFPSLRMVTGITFSRQKDTGSRMRATYY